jgi:nicotinamidase-related amidase
MEYNSQNTALLVMDMQAAILRNFPDAELLITKVKNAITHAHESSFRVIYVRVGFRQGTPEISTNNKSFTAARERFAQLNTEEFLKIEPAIEPGDDDIVVTKRRVSSFTGSDLEVILRAQAVGHIVLTGISTSGVVLSTLREAADRDYRITVLSDGCGDGDDEVHSVLTTKIFPRQAEVVTVDEWIHSN